MQRERVKAHELRKKDEDALVQELTRYRVTTISFSNASIIERVSLIESK